MEKMVNEEVINYLQEGKRRGFSIDILKNELLKGGFEEKDVDEAISESNKREMQMQQQAQKPQTPSQPREISVEGHRKLGIFKKVGKSIAHPKELFFNTRGQGILPPLGYYYFIAIAPFLILSIIFSIFFSAIIASFGLLLAPFGADIANQLTQLSLISFLIIAGFFAVVFFITIPALTFITTGILHLIVKIFSGTGRYADTFAATIYSSTPSMLFSFIPLAPAVWSFILMLFGLSIMHGFSKLRALFSSLVNAIFYIIIYFGTKFALTLV